MLRTKKILRDSVREYRGISLRAPVYVTLESIMECVIPFLMAMLIDYGIDGTNGAGDMGYFWKMGLILIGCTVVTLLFGALPRPAMPRTCATTSTTTCRTSPFPTLSAFPPPASSPA